MSYTIRIESSAADDDRELLIGLSDDEVPRVRDAILRALLAPTLTPDPEAFRHFLDATTQRSYATGRLPAAKANDAAGVKPGTRAWQFDLDTPKAKARTAWLSKTLPSYHGRAMRVEEVLAAWNADSDHTPLKKDILAIQLRALVTRGDVRRRKGERGVWTYHLAPAVTSSDTESHPTLAGASRTASAGPGTDNADWPRAALVAGEGLRAGSLG